MNKPTCEQLFNDDGVKSVKLTENSGWRHGVEKEEIFYRGSDNTYWSAGYRVSTDGETHGLRDGEATIFQVKPIKVETFDYIVI